ncbi:surface antigen [Citreicella sp. SE45]|uniref:Autotransporter secretion outer membrane protein TamA n=1 Tax=Salipiger thiooxidans TaxID=282683 RepID=A0A1G7AG02_9RHOB|nr:BamA/TamA family outer membrane protein [Salipiger thiooxidans]EEX14982.1 surface antigen [Citreicella sp. SE45]NVK58497.1 BamA/TamA family outer membrane protein [Paracoccaceae bacterium]SDE12965.1 autotransporter secretion outer membrane protein TamA [Salipiger thiooxidans]
MTLRRTSVALGIALSLSAIPAAAIETVNFSTPGMDEDLRAQIKSNSALAAAEDEGRVSGQDVLAAALSDYGVLLETLYANGYYGGTISITLDGREAADIPLLQTPDAVNRVVVDVRSGPKYKFRTTRLEPLAPETELPEGFAPGNTARASIVGEAADAGIDGWRQLGRAKAELTYQQVTANHPDRRLDVDMRITPGPELRFGKLRTLNDSAVRSAAQRRIAGLPTGERFDPDELDEVARRLTDTGAFSSVTLREEEVPNADGTLDIELRVADAKPRRFGFGAEISSQDGLTLTTYWLHRNLLGGAEHFRVDAEVSDISSETSEMDASLTARLEVPAAIAELGPDTNAFFQAALSSANEPTYNSDSIGLTAGFTRRFTDKLTGEIGVGLLYSQTEDDLGDREFLLFTLPTSLTWDKRDDDLNAKSGFYTNTEFTPFIDLDGNSSGARLYTDLRGYYGFGESKNTVLAGRLQLGSVIGPELEDTQPEFLFYSGGAGSVRGQPYQSLTVDLGDGDETGGRSFLGLSGEIRQDFGANWGVVAFADAGFISADSAPGGDGEWHSGAGLGVRYNTPIGPLRVDVAAPTSGDTGEGVQLYIGIGQAF